MTDDHVIDWAERLGYWVSPQTYGPIELVDETGNIAKRFSNMTALETFLQAEEKRRARCQPERELNGVEQPLQP